MRPVSNRACAVPSFLATVAALALGACGAEEPTPTASTATTGATTPVPAPKPEDSIPDPVLGPGADFSAFDAPFQVRIEEPIVNEEAVERPPSNNFPTSEPAPRPKIADLPANDPVFGPPLVINGRLIPMAQIKREICLGALGQNEIEDARTRIFITEERARQAERGVAADDAKVGEADVDAYLKDIEENVKQEYPNGELGMQDVMNQLASASFNPREKLRFRMEFAKLFLPDDPAKFPPITQEAILKNEGGQQVLDHYKSSFATRKLEGGGLAPKEAGEMQFDQAILQQVVGYLMDIATVTPNPGPGVLYNVNGVDITVEEIWDRVKDRVRPPDVLAAKQWIVNTTLLEEAFKAAGAWLSDDEAYVAYHAHSDPYKNSVFSIERVALLVKAFPSVDRYKHHRRLIDCFQRMKKPSKEELEAFAKARTKKIIGQVNLDVDLLLCSAYDFKKGTWSDSGWADAENRMRDVLRLLVEEQRPWDELVEKYSDFYSSPIPASQADQPDERPKKGRFRNVQRNGLLGLIGETEYAMFLTGVSVTDFVFFDQEVGTFGQPLRGPYGWYLPRLFRRTKPPERIPMDEGTLNDLILDDYLTSGVMRYAQELIQKNEVYGLEI
jgi:hypothetical protein